MTVAKTLCQPIQQKIFGNKMRYPRNANISMISSAIPLFLFHKNSQSQRKMYTNCQLRNTSQKTQIHKAPPLFGNDKMAKRLISSNKIDETEIKKSPSLNKEIEETPIRQKANKKCPICAKYSKGPCGELFQNWLQCTDDNPGTNESTGKELHVVKCMHLVTPLAECLNEHQKYYDSIPLETEDESQEENDAVENDRDSKNEKRNIREAWQKIVEEIEMDPKIQKNTHKFKRQMAPEMEVRFKSNLGVAWFDEKNLVCENGKQLLIAYLKDQNEELLGAGTIDDIEDGGGLMRFKLSKDTEYVTLNVLYDDDENGPLYTLTQRLPPREGNK